jgi:hypothetical protein
MMTMSLANGYDRRKTPEVSTYRAMTVEEAKGLRYGQTVWFLANSGTARQAKVNGAPKTWKKDSARVEVPLKYGLYDFFRDTNCADGTMLRLLVPVS